MGLYFMCRAGLGLKGNSKGKMKSQTLAHDPLNTTNERHESGAAFFLHHSATQKKKLKKSVCANKKDNYRVDLPEANKRVVTKSA